MKELTDKLLSFLRADPKRTAVLGAGVCLCLAAVIITVCLVLSGGETAETPTVSVPDGAALTSDWPAEDLPDCIPEPKNGKVVAVHKTERTTAVFLEDFPAEDLRGYLDGTGLEFEGTAPYVAAFDGKTVAVAYSAADGLLSVTVIF